MGYGFAVYYPRKANLFWAERGLYRGSPVSYLVTKLYQRIIEIGLVGHF
jgi:hypothetical protein